MARKQRTVYNDYDRDQVKVILKKRKAKRRKKRIKILLVILMIILIIAFFISDYSRLKSITVNGINRIERQEIVDAAKINLHQDYIFFTNTDAIASRIKKVSLVKDVKVSKNLFGDITIKVVEADPIGQCMIGDILYVIDETGRIAIDNNGLLINYVQRCPRLNNFDYDRLVEFSKEFAKIPSQVINQISDINYAPQTADETRCEFIMDDGKILYLRYDDMAEQLKGNYYALLMEKYPDDKYYDFLGKYVYRSK